jgi:LmbE family N-acetylglucosaminyl deacetylase
MVRIIRQCRPKVLITTHWDDPHPDHASTCRIVRQAARLATMTRYDEEATQGPVPMPAIMHSLFSRLVVPSFIVDVSDFVEEKMKAIRSHSSQFYSEQSQEPATRISDKGFLDQIEYRMRYFGSLIGVKAGEPFFVREALNVDDPVALLTRPMNIYS